MLARSKFRNCQEVKVYDPVMIFHSLLSFLRPNGLRPVLLALGLCAFAHAQASPQSSAGGDWTRVPGTEWERAKPETLGYSSARLKRFEAGSRSSRRLP